MLLLPFCRALHLAATLLLGGAFGFELLLLARCGAVARDAAVRRPVDRWLQRQSAWALAVGGVSWAGWLAATAIAMSGLPAAQALAPGVLATVLTQTTFGHAWLLRGALFAVLAALVALRRRDRASLGVPGAALALVLVASLAWTGHALGTNGLHVWVDAAHLVAACVWLGMLPMLALLMRRAVARAGAWRALGLACADRFFAPGVVAVAVLAASGVANTAWMLADFSDLATTRYGRILVAKLALFALMLALAGTNRFVLVPRLARSATGDRLLRALRATVCAEVLAGAAVLAVVAWLGVTPPAAHEHTMNDMPADMPGM